MEKFFKLIAKTNGVLMFIIGFLMVHFINDALGLNAVHRIFSSMIIWIILFLSYQQIVRKYGE